MKSTFLSVLHYAVPLIFLLIMIHCWTGGWSVSPDLKWRLWAALWWKPGHMSLSFWLLCSRGSKHSSKLEPFSVLRYTLVYEYMDACWRLHTVQIWHFIGLFFTFSGLYWYHWIHFVIYNLPYIEYVQHFCILHSQGATSPSANDSGRNLLILAVVFVICEWLAVAVEPCTPQWQVAGGWSYQSGSKQRLQLR